MSGIIILCHTLIFFDIGGGSKRVYRGEDEWYLDKDPELRSWTEYEYMVEVFNSVGSFSSPWEKIRTAEAAPIGVIEPDVKVYIMSINPMSFIVFIDSCYIGGHLQV